MSQMSPHMEKANRALFEGNRNEVIELLRDRAATGAELWLLAAAVEDENERIALLRRVHAIGEQPYAELAYDILRREASFAEELRKGPAWQRWLIERRDILLRISIAIIILSLTLIILGLILFD